MADSETNGETAMSLKRTLNGDTTTVTPAIPVDVVDSSLQNSPGASTDAIESAAKRVKIDTSEDKLVSNPQESIGRNGSAGSEIVPSSHTPPSTRVKGMASIKPEYLLNTYKKNPDPTEGDDAAEQRGKDDRDNGGGGKKKQKKQKGQNKERKFGTWGDAIKLCNSRAYFPEFLPEVCKFGDSCKMCHDLRKYMKEGKNQDLQTFGAICPVYEAYGKCNDGWKCRFAGSHSEEMEHEDGRKELVLKENMAVVDAKGDDEVRTGIYNIVSTEVKLALAKRQFDLRKSETYVAWLDKETRETEKLYNQKRVEGEERQEYRAQFVDPPFLPSEKRRVYFDASTPVLAPLTTQGNLPFRRMCVEFGAQLTYSEMAFGMPMIQGQKNDWALMKAHASEISPPRAPTSIVQGYDNSKDLKFSVQIEANQIMPATKATEAVTALVPHLRLVDLNCGCPLDAICKEGGGSSLLESYSKLEKMVRGMNIVSRDVPITVKIRTGSKDVKPTAQKIIERMAFGGEQARERHGAPGCAAITLHGRSKQQRYTKDANWSYIAECAALVKSYNKKKDGLTDTIREADERTQANNKNGEMYFIGNGDCYSHVQYYDNIKNSGVDSVMIARGALIKPWVFEEIEKGDYIDKSATERLSYVEKFARYGLEAWGSDEMGVGTTRRFLLEWLSFAHRYVPVGLLEHLPPSIQDRPPAYRGRNELETLLASENYLDWIKISEMFLGPAHKDFSFVPKHKSNAYEAEG
ncbi:tRNA-dihydrouridine(47) synthase [NAD(P)(+)] [Calycina marina]|uniref:tRNA-dihydrouridine(47) synthase [NAD(P)(+)] n=1 Tax=Calycina marina TaxID=1763456 RepID=A0A9P8CEU7_9HELO|nr:tRNA-dihydrouridine(47) synthase [NAD(P)(+)] [Calycina marina]